MIKKVVVHNFMSHKHTELEFPEGITLLAGSSFSGKSAVMDAIKWVTDNRPTGDGYISNWTRDDKGRLKDETFVTVEFDDHVVTRYRSKESNRYILDGMPLDAIGTDVPEPVRNAINFSEVNSQNQMDPLFLLSSTGGDIARLLNKTVKLDLIDVFLSGIDSKKRSTKKDIETAKTNIDSIDRELTDSAYLGKAEKILSKLETLSKESEKLALVVGSLSQDIKNYGSMVNSIDTIDEIVASASTLRDKILSVEKIDTSVLERSVAEYRKQAILLSNTSIIPLAEKLVSKMTKYLNLSLIDTQDIATVYKSLQEYRTHISTLEAFEGSYIALQKELPSVCPSCGKPLEECSE